MQRARCIAQHEPRSIIAHRGSVQRRSIEQDTTDRRHAVPTPPARCAWDTVHYMRISSRSAHIVRDLELSAASNALRSRRSLVLDGLGAETP